MPIQNTKYLKYAFAQNGDYEYMPDDNPTDDSVSLSNGFGIKYEMNPEADGLFIKRRQFNGLLNLVTGSVRDYQINGTRLWSSEIAQAQGYPAGARVSVFLDMGTNKLTLAPSKFTFKNKDFYMANTIQLVSLVDENKDDPTIDNNTFKTWWIDDGNDLFHTKITLVSAKNGYYPVPLGYIDIGSNTPDIKYKYDDYPRVKYMKSKNALPDCLTDNTDDTFSVVDFRGRFFRVWSNGSASIDTQRAFGDLQQDAIRDFWIYRGYDGLEAPKGNNNWDMSYRNYQDYGGGGDGGGAGRDMISNFIPKVSLSPANVPTSGTINKNQITNDDGENRPYNFNIRMYLKV